MATKKQIEANRRNAKKSTGPKSSEGKARASRNALRHGLTAREVLLADEDPAAYEELRLTLIQELWPDSPLELLLVERIAATQWRLLRVPTIEAQLFARLRRDALGRDEGLGAAWERDAGPAGGSLARLSRYEATLQRSLTRLLEELRHMQRERRAQDAQEAAAAEAHRGDWWLRPEAAWPGAPAPHSPGAPAESPNEASSLPKRGAAGPGARPNGGPTPSKPSAQG